MLSKKYNYNKSVDKSYSIAIFNYKSSFFQNFILIKLYA